MRIGVICEGRTDFPAIRCFFGNALQALGVEAQFQPLYPKFDNTRPGEGWSNVLNWLEKHSPEFRVQSYFRGGLFSIQKDALDAIVIQLDADVVDDNSFKNFVSKKYGIQVAPASSPAERAREIKQVIEIAGKFDNMCAADVGRHVIAPAVESSETWCVAAFSAQPGKWELLQGQALTNAFMAAMERSEGRSPQAVYANVDKDFSRRNRFCETHAEGASRIMNSCTHFASAVKALQALA